MSLKSQIAQMRQEIEYYQDSASLEDKKDALKVISERLVTASKTVEDEAGKHECLKEINGVDLYVEGSVESLSRANDKLQAFKTLWLELEDKSRSDEQDTLYSLTEALISTAKLFADSHQVIWDEWSNEQKSLAQVDEFILEQQKNVHGNIELYNQYTTAKRDFDAQMDGFNFDIGRLLRIQQFAQQCAELKEQMNTEDLPDGVKKLFDTLNTVGAVAFVSMLTPEVMQWLEQNDKLDTLVVRQR